MHYVQVSHWKITLGLVSRLYSSCSGNTVREEILPVEFIILHRTILDYNASQYRTLIYVRDSLGSAEYESDVSITYSNTVYINNLH